jgi:hypothetical protein
MNITTLNAVIAGILVGIVSQAHGGSVTFYYDVSYGDVPPDGPAPYATATFEDSGIDKVTLTIQTAPTIGAADIAAIYFNLDTALDPTSLNFTRIAGTGPTAADTDIYTGVDAYKAAEGGLFDIRYQFPPPPGGQARRFNAGEELVYEISSPGLSANSFNVYASPAPGTGNIPYLSVVKMIDTGPIQEDGDWVGAAFSE